MPVDRARMHPDSAVPEQGLHLSSSVDSTLDNLITAHPCAAIRGWKEYRCTGYKSSVVLRCSACVGLGRIFSVARHDVFIDLGGVTASLRSSIVLKNQLGCSGKFCGRSIIRSPNVERGAPNGGDCRTKVGLKI